MPLPVSFRVDFALVTSCLGLFIFLRDFFKLIIYYNSGVCFFLFLHSYRFHARGLYCVECTPRAWDSRFQYYRLYKTLPNISFFYKSALNFACNNNTNNSRPTTSFSNYIQIRAEVGAKSIPKIYGHGELPFCICFRISFVCVLSELVS